MNRFHPSAPPFPRRTSPPRRARAVATAAVAAALLWTATGLADEPSTVEIITRFEHEFAEAALRGDATGIAHLLDPGFVGVNARGKELTRDEVLANLASPEYEIRALSHDNIRVRVFDDCAVVLAVTKVTLVLGGEEVSGEFPYIRVWVERDGSWRAVATQSMVIPEG